MMVPPQRIIPNDADDTYDLDRQAICVAVSTEKVARKYTELEPFGRDGWYTGNCPRQDHNDRGQSFYISQSGSWECYGCGRSGDVVDLEFLCGNYDAPQEAMMSLAIEYGIELPHERNGHHKPQSRSQSLYRGSGLGLKPQVVRLSDVEPPGPRRYSVKDLVLAAYVTLLYGDGGVAKSLLALSLAVAISGGSKEWLGRQVENTPVLYVDFELDIEEQARRVHQVCRGQGVGKPPRDLLYMSALGYTASDAFAAALEACKEDGIGLVILDSLGPALQGDAEAARDVIGFFQQRIEPFRAEGIAVLIIDHQSRLQPGQSYQSKGAFGSVFKTNLARSVIQAQATERAEGTLTVRLRQKKHNFGPLAEPFGVKLTFSEEAVSLQAIDLDATELAEEDTLNATDRVKLALENGPAYPWEIAEATGLALKTVRNALTGLRKQGTVEPTGEVENRTERVRFSVPQSQSLYRDGDRDSSVYINEAGEAEF